MDGPRVDGLMTSYRVKWQVMNSWWTEVMTKDRRMSKQIDEGPTNHVVMDQNIPDFNIQRLRLQKKDKYLHT